MNIYLFAMSHLLGEYFAIQKNTNAQSANEGIGPRSCALSVFGFIVSETTI